jgi:hypothetical protein
VSREPVRIGGLMRCCLETIREYDKPGVEGDIVNCKYCSSSMRFRDGVWEWNHDIKGMKP